MRPTTHPITRYLNLFYGNDGFSTVCALLLFYDRSEEVEKCFYVDLIPVLLVWVGMRKVWVDLPYGICVKEEIDRDASKLYRGEWEGG
jgi:hypothetical protein